MQLKIQRSQRQSGVMAKAVMFCLDARIHLTPDEQGNVQRYRLGGQNLYSSEAAKRHAEGAAGEHFTSAQSWARGLYHAAAARMSLNITVDSLQRGQHIECKDLNEVLDAEDALDKACRGLRTYLNTAATFDGREAVIDYTNEEPQVVSAPVLAATPPMLPAPVTVPPPLAGPGPSSYEEGPITSAGSPPIEPGMRAFSGEVGSTAAISPGEDMLRHVTAWWNGLTPEQRKWLMIGAGVGALILLIWLR